MASFAEDIAGKLVTAGVATAINTDIFLGSAAKIPSKPENVGPYLSLIDTGGFSQLTAHSGGLRRPSLQIVARAASAPVAKTKALAVYAALGGPDGTGLRNVTLGSTFYLEITPVQDVLDMQRDEVGRPRYGFNINIVSR